MIDFNFCEECYGCGVCKHVCPQNAIKLEENQYGFFNPIIDKEKCNNCGLCEKKCIRLNNKVNDNKFEDAAYALQLINKDDLAKSTSGGAFYAIAKEFIANDGYVCGCIWSEECEPYHIVSNDIKIIEKMRGSKYVQSDLKDVFVEIKEKLTQKKNVLFSGTPCQIYALKQFCNMDNLYTIALICEGIPSRKVWREYKGKLEKNFKSKIVDVNYRNKDNCGWERPDVVYTFENGKKLSNLSFNLDMYISSFIDGILMNKICYMCDFKGEKINSDLIIGDFWKLPKKIFAETRKSGVSAIIVNSIKGNELIESAKKNVNLINVDKKTIINGNKNLILSIEKNEMHNNFFENIDNIEICKNLKKNNIKMRSPKKYILKVLYKTNLIKYIDK